MLDSDYPEQVCSVARALEVDGQRWTLIIVRELMFGRRRFDQLLASVGTTPATLTRRLQGLIDDDVVRRSPYQQRPRRFEYDLTDKGRDLFEVLTALMAWGDRHYGPAPRLLMHASGDHPLDPYAACGRCDQPSRLDDIEPQPGPGATDTRPASH
jgi:DNA-binding HxlR family transcriptional regulator